MARKDQRYLVCVWICFLIRGVFYSSVLPLWEGFDEWAHFAVAENISTTGKAIIDRNSAVSREINASLQLAPLPRGMTLIRPPAVTHEQYWKLSTDEQNQRQSALRALPAHRAEEFEPNGMPAYQASQPPLYYWILAITLRPFRNDPLLARLWIARFITFFIGSLDILIGFSLARKALSNGAAAVILSALIALMPEMSLNLARVSNEGLGITVYTALLLAVYGWIEAPRLYSRTIAVGVLLGIGLLTKAYFLTALPGLALVYLWAASRRSPEFQSWVRHALTAFAIAFVLAGWWYFRNYLQTGTISGLDEAVILKNTALSEKVAAFFHLNWPRAIATVFISHIWYGGWSLLALPRRVYVASFGLLAVPFLGLLKSARSLSKPERFFLLSFYGCFWLGQAYQMLMLFLSKSSSTAIGGWYLYSLIWAECILGLAGMQAIVPFPWQKRAVILYVIAVAGLDFYGMHFVALPYYGHVGDVFHLDLSELLINKPSFITPEGFISAWVLFLVTSGFISIIAIRAARRFHD